MGSKSAIGIGNGICFKQVRDKGGGSYIDPLVRDSLVGVWIADQNTNESPTRNIIKNTIKDKGGDLELLNFGYKLNSGYGKYEENFTDTTRWEVVSGVNKKPYELQVTTAWNPKIDWIALIKGSGDLKSVSLNVSGIPNEGTLFFYYGTDSIQLYNGNNKVTLSGAIPQTTSGYRIIKGRDLDWSNLVITQIPSFEGALVTDGKDDIIVSQKTVQEMLGGSSEYTVLSMIHHIDVPEGNIHSNTVRIKLDSLGTSNKITSFSNNKTGIYGYTVKNQNITVINNILGDKNDYGIRGGDYTSNLEAKFSVIGWIGEDDILRETASIACYWTIIANKVLTTDQINQVISYFNLDKHVKPDVYYDVKKQGLSNDTPEADWYLKDFSGNGHDMTLYNFAKKLGSGIGKYEADYSTWIKTEGVISTPFGLKITEPTHNYWILYTSNITVPAHKVKILGIPEGGEFRYLGVHILKNGINELPKMEEHPSAIGFTLHKGTTQPSDWVGLSVEQIPDYEGALVSDGIDDYGKVENLPIYKDYTVAIDRAWTNDLVKAQCLTSKLNGDNFGSFSFELIENGFSSYSFGISNKGVITIDSNKKISYQSKHVYNSSPIISGNNVDGKDLFLFRNQDSYPYYAEAAIWSYILFPYSLSEFLLERQLKRYKLGTLYPNMVEWRPIISSNIPYDKIEFFDEQWTKRIYPGDYVEIGTTIKANLYLNNYDISTITSLTSSQFESVYIDRKRQYYDVVLSGIKKSPQKIAITIDESTSDTRILYSLIQQ